MCDIKYLAGLVDGEGHINMFMSTNGRGDKHPRALIRIVQSEHNQGEQLFDVIQTYYGGFISYKKKYGMYEWSLYGKDAQALAKRLKPYLMVKAYQVQRIL